MKPTSKIKHIIAASLMSTAILAGTVISVAPAFAQDFTVQNGTVDVQHKGTTTVDGPLAADGSITVKGANQAQSIKNKTFVFYKLFDVENAAANESVNYKFVDKYKASIQKVVMKAINKRDKGKAGFKEIKKYEDVSEYMAIDYIQSLNTHKVEGATAEQVRESNYSAFRYFTEDVKNQIKADKVDGDKITVGTPDAENKFTVNGLSWGYYLVDEESTGDSVSNGKPTKDATTPEGHKAASDGTHFASSLVLLSTVNNKATIQLKSDYPEILKKIQEDSDKKEAGNNGWNDMADYEIGQTVPYYNTIRVPNMNGYHGYYMAIQDKMDKALTFHANKSKIKIQITSGTINKDGSITGGKTYTVKDNEWNLSTHGENVSKQWNEAKVKPEGDTTFYAEFEDFKAIVDREFNRPTAQPNENDYSGLKVLVKYEAELNEKAAEDTGRPGYENDVRLVYSNNPDTTGTGYNQPTTPPKDQPKGKTPWDTVVAFTYKLNGLKVNSNNYALEDAHFRLYSDPEMKNEVFVKQSHNNVAATDKTDKDTHAKQGESKGASNTNGTVGQTNNLTGQVDNPTRGNNAYTVINRDKLGGNDHTGGQAPADSTVIKSDKNGNFSIVGLDSGTYYLKEVKAPRGYRLLKDPIKVTIKGNFTESRNNYVKGEGATAKTLQSITADGDIREFYDQILKTGTTRLNTNVQEGSVDIKVKNEVLSKLPNTGEKAMAVFLVAVGVGVVTFGVYSLVKNNRKDEADA